MRGPHKTTRIVKRNWEYSLAVAVPVGSLRNLEITYVKVQPSLWKRPRIATHVKL